jgi:hypothetical protein
MTFFQAVTTIVTLLIVGNRNIACPPFWTHCSPLWQIYTMAGLASALAKRAGALKQVEKAEEKGPQLVICDGDESYAKLMRETYLEEYMKSIDEFTFATVFVPLAKEAADAILEVGAPFNAGGTHVEGVGGPEAEAEARRLSDLSDEEVYAAALTTGTERPVLAALAERIDAAIAENGGGRAFIRLSSRSPKDAALRVGNFPALVKEQLAEVRKDMVADGVDLSSPEGKVIGGINAELWGLYRASTRSMSVATGKEAIALLLLSDRIRDDLTEVANPKEGDPPFNVCGKEIVIDI